MNEQEWHERNCQRMREYHEKNKEAINARHKAYYAEHREELLARQREKRKADKLACGETIRVKPTPEEIYQRKLERNRRWRAKRRAETPAKPRQALLARREKYKNTPRCPICGDYQTNTALIHVCSTCGSRISK